MTYDDGGNRAIKLDISKALRDEETVTSFKVIPTTQCIVVGLNHKYEKKTIVCTVYLD